MIGAFADTQAYSSPIEVINSKRPLELGKFSIIDDDSVLSVDFSPHGGGLLAGVCISGQVKVWQVSEKSEVDHWPLLRVLRDSEEAQIDEFFTGNFLPNGQFVVAGKRKHRHQWNESTGEAQSLPGLLKFFDLKSGKCIRRLGPCEENFADKQKNSGHTDEVLFLKPISTASKGNFILSCGQDGRLCRWSFSRDWNSFLGVSSAKLGNLVFHCDQISDELVGVAVDNGLVIYDILNMKHIRSFKTGFTSYCDYVKVIQRDGFKIKFLLRGVELLKTDTQEASAPNSIIITQVNLKESGARITNRLRHELYNANSWLIKPATSASNEYLAAPTITGRILIFNIETGQLTASFHTHDDSEVRQVLFHPQLPIMVSCGDDGRIRIYYQK